MTSNDECDLAAARVARLIARGEISEAGLYSTDAKFWHNTDEIWAPIAEAPARMAAIRQAIPDFRAEETETNAWAGGFVVQYAFVGTAPGDRIRIVGCLVATVREGKITRMREYVDSAHTATLKRLLAAKA